MLQRKTLINYDNSKLCYDKIEQLNQAYKKAFNRNSKAELFYSLSGSESKPSHAITVYFSEKDGAEDLSFFENLLNK